MSTASPSKYGKGSRKALRSLWVSTTYFGEGFPYSVVNNLAEILFKQMGASLQVIGLTSLFHLPWNLKFLWGPLLDHYETKRRWLIGVEVLMTITLLIVAWLSTLPHVMAATAAMFLVMAVLSATHDIAIDGFYLEGLDEAEQSRFVGYRAMAYKLASLLVRGPLVVLIGWVGWRGGLQAAAGIVGVLALVHGYILPRVEKRERGLGQLARDLLRPRLLIAGALIALVVWFVRRVGWAQTARGYGSWILARAPWLGHVSVAGWIALGLLALLLVMLAALPWLRRRAGASESYYIQAFVDFLSTPRVGWVLAFVVLFRTGESFLQKMKWPFLHDVVGLGLTQYGLLNGTVGVLASFVGTFVGGWLISRQGLARWVWPFVLAQNLLNLLYVVLASLPKGGVGLGLTALTITLENFGEGLGTAVFMVFLMRSCHPKHKAAHMAILTALMSVSFTIAGVASGFLASSLGFRAYFVFTFLATIPGMALIPFVPHIRRE